MLSALGALGQIVSYRTVRQRLESIVSVVSIVSTFSRSHPKSGVTVSSVLMREGCFDYPAVKKLAEEMAQPLRSIRPSRGISTAIDRCWAEHRSP